MTPLGAVVGQLALPAAVPVVITVLMLGMARLEAHLLEPGDRRAATHDPPTPEDLEDMQDMQDMTGPVPAFAPGPGELGELNEQRV